MCGAAVPGASFLWRRCCPLLTVTGRWPFFRRSPIVSPERDSLFLLFPIADQSLDRRSPVVRPAFFHCLPTITLTLTARLRIYSVNIAMHRNVSILTLPNIFRYLCNIHHQMATPLLHIILLWFVLHSSFVLPYSFHLFPPSFHILPIVSRLPSVFLSYSHRISIVFPPSSFQSSSSSNRRSFVFSPFSHGGTPRHRLPVDSVFHSDNRKRGAHTHKE